MSVLNLNNIYPHKNTTMLMYDIHSKKTVSANVYVMVILRYLM